MREFNITIIKGDGIDPEIMDDAIEMLDYIKKNFMSSLTIILLKPVWDFAAAPMWARKGLF